MALIQLPIWIGIYQVVRILTDHAAHPEKLGQLAYPFVQQLDEVQRVIAHPEAFNKTLFGVIDLTRHALRSLRWRDGYTLCYRDNWCVLAVVDCTPDHAANW